MPLKPVLELAALILSLVNGLILLRFYLRDRPRIQVEPVHPDIYQWFFELPPGQFEKMPTRNYGFLGYIGISNRGLRDVCLKSWHLEIKTKRNEWHQLRPVNITEPEIKIGKVGTKVLPVLGQKGLYFEGSTMVKSGASISGVAYYVASYYGHDSWNPDIKSAKVEGRFVIETVFKSKARTKLFFKRKALDEIK